MPAAFEILETGFQTALEEERAGPVVSCVRIGGLRFQGLVETDQSLLDLACLFKSDAKTGQGFGIMRFNTQGFVIAGHGFQMTIKFLQNIAAIKPLVRGGGIKADGFIETPFVVERLRVTVAVSRGQVIGGERFLETAELLQNIASIELRFRIGRTAPGGFFISGESIFEPSEFLQDGALVE